MVERLADQLLAHRDVVLVDRPAAAPRPGAERSFARRTTAEMLAVECAVIDVALRRREDGVAIADPVALDTALAARPSLSGEQQAMVRRLTCSGAGVDVVVGKAGTGKSHALAAAREAWQSSGTPGAGRRGRGPGRDRPLRGGLHAGDDRRPAAHPDRTPATGGASLGASLGATLREGWEQAALPRSAVLAVDEAGILGTRDLARLLAATEHAHGKLVLVGDHRQLPELAAGGAFIGLARQLDPVVLRQNRRQVEHWERDALDQLRAGRVDAALDAYAAADRVTVAATGEQQRAALVAAWSAVEKKPPER